VLTVVENRLARPRDYRSAEFLALVDHLHEIITGSALPDQAPETRPPAAVEPLPEVQPSEIVGLLEYLAARGGKDDVFRIAGDTNRPFGRIIEVVEGAELLDFVHTPKRLVVLEPPGRRFLDEPAPGRERLWREALLKLGLFRQVHEVLQRQPEHTIDRDFVLESIIMTMPQENYERIFETFIAWARFGNLFAYDEATATLSLPPPEPT
jgi:NitT/TauT family transport system ATP-binding protein